MTFRGPSARGGRVARAGTTSEDEGADEAGITSRETKRLGRALETSGSTAKGFASVRGGTPRGPLRRPARTSRSRASKHASRSAPHVPPRTSSATTRCLRPSDQPPSEGRHLAAPRGGARRDVLGVPAPRADATPSSRARQPRPPVSLRDDARHQWGRDRRRPSPHSPREIPADENNPYVPTRVPFERPSRVPPFPPPASSRSRLSPSSSTPRSDRRAWRYPHDPPLAPLLAPSRRPRPRLRFSEAYRPSPLGKGATPSASAAVVEPLRATLREAGLLRRDAPRAPPPPPLSSSPRCTPPRTTPAAAARARRGFADPARRGRSPPRNAKRSKCEHLELATTNTKTIVARTRRRRRARGGDSLVARRREGRESTRTRWRSWRRGGRGASDDADRAAAELSRKERLAPGSRSATDGGRFASATPARRRFLALLAHGKWLRESGWGGEDEKKDDVTTRGGGVSGVSGVTGTVSGVAASRSTSAADASPARRVVVWREGGRRNEIRAIRETRGRFRRARSASRRVGRVRARRVRGGRSGGRVVAVARAQIRLAIGDVVGAERTLAAAAKAAPGDADATMTYARFVEAMRRATEPESEEEGGEEGEEESEESARRRRLTSARRRGARDAAAGGT